MADEGNLDLVLALGDLVDFVEQGITRSQAAPNNWRLFVEILTGAGDEARRGNPGLRLPFFTTLGNHDWRSNPYPPEIEARIFGLTTKEAEQLDYVYRDSSEAVGKRIHKVHDRLVKEGSPILAHSWWRSLVSFGLRGAEVLWNRMTARFWAWANSAIRYLFYLIAAALVGGLGMTKLSRPTQETLILLNDTWTWHPVLTVSGVVLVVLLGWFGLALLRTWAGSKLRRLVQGLIAIEKSPPGLSDYFLLLNPYFNYAFELGNCYFLVLDTGHDCLTAESFWDEGGKKVERLSLGDNIIGGSPDTMGFYPPNVHFPYGQIAWMERVLGRIQKDTGQRAGEGRRCRVFVGLHSPAANLSAKESSKAREELGLDDSMLLPRPEHWADRGYNVRYGTINHYLSQFYYLCLGAHEGAIDVAQAQRVGCGVDVVLSGHAHWCQEFRLAKPCHAQAQWKPELYWGRFSKVVERAFTEREVGGLPADWLGPLLLQTAGCGPRSLAKGHKGDDQPPYARLITVEPDMWIRDLKQVKVS